MWSPRMALVPAFLLMFCGAAAAAALGAGPLFATTADDLNCSLFNVGPTSFSILAIRIHKGDGTVASASAGLCAGPLAVGHTCVVKWSVTATDFYSCRAVAAGTVTAPLRGLFFRRTQSTVSNSLELR